MGVTNVGVGLAVGGNDVAVAVGYGISVGERVNVGEGISNVGDAVGAVGVGRMTTGCAAEGAHALDSNPNSVSPSRRKKRWGTDPTRRLQGDVAGFIGLCVSTLL